MRNQLIKALQHQLLLDIIYIAKDGKMSKRRVKLIKITGETAQAYCFTKQAKRTFIIENILAIAPSKQKGHQNIV
ncbi:transcriptional regulator [Metasolibacillus sp.]|uniref:transcriptional regulator n=1 Tax=Metasolibacillus sp. TaxID=2703680 RepID=UPI0025E2A233|nr:transcriptional regulator [Metasolibacillus sp.]MCT6925855.1 transcriptional regulator [Metasolibacillus sp.]MCT6942012.1 transcriptional regulator [Metasolibacillus sp.]